MLPISSPHLAALGSFSGLEIGLSLLVVILTFMLWRLTHHEECHYTGVPSPSIGDSLNALAGNTNGHLRSGNSVELVQNAQYFDALIAAMQGATQTVHFETFLWAEGEASDRVVNALISAAKRGLEVRILCDASGSQGLTSKTADKLRGSGCHFYRFHPYRIQTFGRWNVRDHRKILVVDGRLAFVGGHCITDDWLRDGEKLPTNRDISARITGPVVASIQSCFLENWTEITGELFTDDKTFPFLADTGTHQAHVAYVKTDRCPSAVQVLHHLSIGYADRKIRIQNPYFLPDPSSARALSEAAQRGVDVKIMIPALTATDSPWVTRAGRFQFQRLLENGVRIFEYQKTLLHQKVITIDGVWSGIGSSNFDDRSFEINDEITLGVADENIARELEETFEDDLKECREIDLKAWRTRPWRTRACDAVLYLFSEQF